MAAGLWVVGCGVGCFWVVIFSVGVGDVFTAVEASSWCCFCRGSPARDHLVV